MKAAYKPIWVIFAGLVVVVAATSLSQWMKAPEIIPWRTDLAVAQTEATQSGKPVFLYFTATWCVPCQGLKSTTWADHQVEAALAAYVPVKIDVDLHPDLVKKYLYTPDNTRGAIPAFRVLGDQGQIKRQSTGAMNPAEFLQWLSGK